MTMLLGEQDLTFSTRAISQLGVESGRWPIPAPTVRDAELASVRYVRLWQDWPLITEDSRAGKTLRLHVMAETRRETRRWAA